MSEESVNPNYSLLHEAPIAAEWPSDATPDTSSVQSVESSAVTQKRRAWMLLIIPAVFLVMIASLFCSMLQWLLLHRLDRSLSNSALIVNETAQWCQLFNNTINNLADCQGSSLLGLALSGLLSKTISFSVTYFMAMAIMCAGSSWLKATSSGETRDMPTPLQYGLLLTMSSATFGSAWEGWTYLIWRQKRRPRAPFLVKSTFASLMMLLFFSSIVTVADAWLHFSTATITVTITDNVTGSQEFKPSLALDLSICGDTPDTPYENTCAFDGINGIIAGTLDIQDVGNQVVANTSNAFQVLTFWPTENHPTSVIVPTTVIPSGISFRSTSYGFGATCEQFTRKCRSNLSEISIPESMVELTSPVNYNCSVDGSVLPNRTITFTSTGNPSITNSTFTAYNLQGSQNNVTQLDNLTGKNLNNPFGFAQLMTWTNSRTDTPEYFDTLGIDMEFQAEIDWFIGACNISVYDVELLYANGAYHLFNYTLSGLNTTSMLFLPFLEDFFIPSFGPRMILNLAVQLNNNATDFLVEVALQVSQLGIGLNAGLFMPTETMSNITMQKTFVASRYPMNALYMLWASIACYLILGIGLLARAASERGEILLLEPVTKSSDLESQSHSAPTISTLELAQQRVVNPFAIIAQYFVLSTSDGHQPNESAPTLSIQQNTWEMFGDEKCESNRLGSGFQGKVSRTDERLRGRAFGVGYQDRPEVEG